MPPIGLGISRIVYGCKKDTVMVNKRYYEGQNNIEELDQQNTHHIELVYIPDLEEHMHRLVAEWEKQFS